jgi:hypothetical protein
MMQAIRDRLKKASSSTTRKDYKALVAEADLPSQVKRSLGLLAPSKGIEDLQASRDSLRFKTRPSLEAQLGPPLEDARARPGALLYQGISRLSFI